VFINIFFVFTKGAKKMMSEEHDWSDSKAAWISACVAGVCAAGITMFIPMIRKWAHDKVRDGGDRRGEEGIGGKR